ncbi:MAG: hypothetical protein Kow0031_38630 [Anaerolineae bacterium]
MHGAGAQRSDPKSSAGLSVIGAACGGGTAHGLGPQGDAQRGANTVRLVRDADIIDATTPGGDHQVFLPLVSRNSGTMPASG